MRPLYTTISLLVTFSYASEGEHDQAISAYFSASKLMPGSHLPYLYLGLEYSLSNNIKLALKVSNYPATYSWLQK